MSPHVTHRYVLLTQKSTNEWLHPVGDDLSDIITQKNKADIKEHLQPIVEHYPDFRWASKKPHLYLKYVMLNK